MLFSVIICRIWSFATAINKLLFDKNCHICNSYQKGSIFYQSHKVFYTTNVTAEYLEPNGIDPATFSWPSSESSSWNYFDDLYTSCYLCVDLQIPFTEDELTQYEGEYPTQDKELFEAVFFGILNWMDSKGSYDTAYYSAVLGKLNPYVSNLPANVTFN